MEHDYDKSKRASFNQNRIKENQKDKTGNHRPRRPVKDKFIKPEEISFEF